MAYYRGITNVAHLQLHKNNYFNIAKARREKRAKQRKRECACAWMEDRDQWSGEEAWDVSMSEEEEERRAREVRSAQARESTRWMPRR